MPDNEINPVGMRHSIFQSDHIPTSLTLDGMTGQGGRFHRTTHRGEHGAGPKKPGAYVRANLGRLEMSGGYFSEWPGRRPWYLLTTETIQSSLDARHIVLAYARRWQIEMFERFTKSEIAFECPHLFKWEACLKFLLIASLAYTFQLFLLELPDTLLRLLLSFLPPHQKVEPSYLSSTLSLTPCN